MADHATINHAGVTGVPSATAPNPTTIELGHASDTTLARVSAGVVSIEGTNIVKAGAATASGLTQATARLLGRTTASTGAIEEISVGSGLSLAAGSLTATGGGGAVATDTIWDAAGDLAVGSGADTAAKLAIGATNGMSLQRVSGAVAWALPKGHELDYVEKTSDTAISASSEGAADTVITATAVSYDGSTRVEIEFYAPKLVAPNGQSLQLALYDGAGSIGILGQFHGSSTNVIGPVKASRFLTPSNASHTYSVRAFTGGSAGTVSAGAGGSGNSVPAYIRQTVA